MPNKNTQNKNVTQSIINCKNYSKNHNYDIKLFRAEGKNSFNARKRALMAHILICEESFCEICNISKKVHTFQYTASNLSRYNETIKSSPKFCLSKKKVQFVKQTNYDILENKNHFNLNLMTLFRACELNTSFKELALLKTL